MFSFVLIQVHRKAARSTLNLQFQERTVKKCHQETDEMLKKNYQKT